MVARAKMDLVQRLSSVQERTLDRVIYAGLLALVVGLGVMGLVYALDRRVDVGPSLLDRRVSSAEAAVRKHPGETGLRLQLAGAYREMNRRDSALDQYAEVLKVDPGQRTALLGRAEVRVEQGELLAATLSYKQVIQSAAKGGTGAVDPQLESAYYGLGWIAVNTKQPRLAIRALGKALKFDPTDADALQLLGVAELQAGDPRRAVRAIRRAVLLVPTGWCDPYKLLSIAYMKLNRGPQAQYAGAMTDFCERRPADAIRQLKPLMAGPAAVDSMLGLGMIAEAQSDRAGAVHWYRRVLAADRSNATARTSLNRVGFTPSAAGPSHPSVPAAPTSNGKTR